MLTFCYNEKTLKKILTQKGKKCYIFAPNNNQQTRRQISAVADEPARRAVSRTSSDVKATIGIHAFRISLPVQFSSCDMNYIIGFNSTNDSLVYRS